jgi:imidazolonepropionase-like amidohydrolase
MPHGTNANDLQYFVDYIGMTPAEALRSATKLGGEIMQKPEELGMLRPGFLADIVLVNGNPLKDLSILTDPAKIQLVMKDGVVHKDCATPVPHEAALHLPGADRPLQEQAVKDAIAAEQR